MSYNEKKERDRNSSQTTLRPLEEARRGTADPRRRHERWEGSGRRESWTLLIYAVFSVYLSICVCVSALQAYAVLFAYVYIYGCLSALRSWEGSERCGIKGYLAIYVFFFSICLECAEKLRRICKRAINAYICCSQECWEGSGRRGIYTLLCYAFSLIICIFMLFLRYFFDYLYLFVIYAISLIICMSMCVLVCRELCEGSGRVRYIYAVLSTYPYIYMYVRVSCGMKKDLIEGDLFIIYGCHSLCLSIYLCVSECDGWEGSGKWGMMSYLAIVAVLFD